MNSGDFFLKLLFFTVKDNILYWIFLFEILSDMMSDRGEMFEKLKGPLGEDNARYVAGLFKPNIAIVCYGDKEFMQRYRAEFEKLHKDDIFVPLIALEFPNKELWVKVDENVRKKRVYVVYNFTGYGSNESECDPNVGLVRLLIINDALKRASVDEITNIVPFIPYLRQDRKDEGRVPISAKLIADLITTSGADRVVTFDLHVPQEQGFFDIPVDNLTALPLFADEFFGENRYIDPKGCVAVAPDAGAMPMTLEFKKLSDAKYGTDLKVATLGKRKGKDVPNSGARSRETDTLYIMGEEHVAGRDVIMMDDMIDSAITACNAAEKLREKGARRIFITGTHGIFSPREYKGLPVSAEEKLEHMDVEAVITDSISRSSDYLKRHPRIKMISLAPMLAEVTHRIDSGDSVSELFQWGD